MRRRLAPDTGWCTILPAVEQRIGSSKQPLEGAGLDPAYIPGLTVPGSREPENTTDADESTAPAKPAGAAREADAGAEAETAGEAEAEADVKTAEAAEDTAVEAEAEAENTAVEAEVAADGPVFEASDRRASILANAAGVRLHLDDQECEFRWDEIAAVETASPRFGRRFTVTVHTPQSRWYFIEIEASSRSRFAEWEKQLDDVLDAYFEEDAGEPASPEKAESAEPAESPEDAVPEGGAKDEDA